MKNCIIAATNKINFFILIAYIYSYANLHKILDLKDSKYIKNEKIEPLQSPLLLMMLKRLFIVIKAGQYLRVDRLL